MDRVLNLKKGDKCIVAIEKCSNASRYVDMSLENIDNWTYEGTVVTVGRKYITVGFNGWEDKFTIDDDYRQKYTCGGADYKLYKDKQEVIDTIKRNILLYNLFGSHRPAKINNLTLDQLKRINAIIEENK